MKIHELLSSEDKWTKDELARDKDGKSVPYDSSNAVKWCLLGAIVKCYQLDNEIVDKIYNEIGSPISFFNDTHTYKEVIAIMRRLDI